MSSEDKFCSKCGAAIASGATSCPSCGNTLNKVQGFSADQKMYWKEYRFARRRGDRTGPLVGGLVVIWLGASLYLARDPLVGSSWWAYFFIGVGVILIAAGLLRWARYAYRYPPTGYLVGGVFLLIIGLASVVQASLFGPGVLIAIGVVILAFGAYSFKGRRSPQSTAPTPQTQS